MLKRHARGTCVPRPVSKACAHPGAVGKHLRTYDAVISDYIARYRVEGGRETRWFAVQKSLTNAIQNAGMARGPSASATGKCGASRHGLLDIPVVSSIHERQSIARIGGHDQEQMSVVNLRDDHIIDV